MSRHRLDVISLFFGVLFLGLGIFYFTDQTELVDWRSAWLWAGSLVLAGAAGVGASVLALVLRRGNGGPGEVTTAGGPSTLSADEPELEEEG